MPALPSLHLAPRAPAGGGDNPTVEIWTLFAIAVCATLLRMYSRLSIVGFRDLRADDLLVWVGVVFYAAQSALGYEVGQASHGLANNSMTEAQRESLSPSDPEYQLRVTGAKLQVAGWTIYSALIWSLKLSMLSFYLRMTSGLPKRYRLSIYIGFGLVVASFIAAFLAIFLSCRPFHNYWQINPNPGNACQAAVSRPIVWATFAGNISSDIYLILIPIPMLWRSSLRMYKKIASTIVFSAGLLVLVCATLKTAYVLVLTRIAQDPITGAEVSAQWGIREAFVAVITNNLPMIFGLLRAWLRPIFGRALGSSRRELYRSPGLQTIGGGGGDRYHRKYPSARPGTGSVTVSNSEEHIVDDVKMQDLKSVSPDHSSMGGILVSNQVDITQENSSIGSQGPERHPWA
ncbi:hypothetical protein PHISCL_08511 [Aspergillus sclerotialis]|uniref:Rhodopsin domain-containing protein n=1 Tax=Aspergillus sclerotialis TaxID=2070753 RepID=A0A3A2Z7S6_9EURO|nr:hypothetical protein PHISCL_08511 [Aspergillus sclerotialis]